MRHHSSHALPHLLAAARPCYTTAGITTTPSAMHRSDGTARPLGVAGRASLLNLCANNYLGLSNHPVLVDAAVAALRSHGFGLSSVRFICGTQASHRRRCVPRKRLEPLCSFCGRRQPEQNVPPLHK